MENEIFIERLRKMQKAAAMESVPILRLAPLVKERKEHALEGNAEAVEMLNKMIAELLAL